MGVGVPGAGTKTSPLVGAVSWIPVVLLFGPGMYSLRSLDLRSGTGRLKVANIASYSRHSFLQKNHIAHYLNTKSSRNRHPATSPSPLVISDPGRFETDSLRLHSVGPGPARECRCSDHPDPEARHGGWGSLAGGRCRTDLPWPGLRPECLAPRNNSVRRCLRNFPNDTTGRSHPPDKNP